MTVPTLRSIQNYRRIVPPNGVVTLRAFGEFVFCRIAEQVLDLTISGQTVQVAAGDKVRFAHVFDELEITNRNDRPVYVEIVCGFGDYSSQIIRGEITVAPGTRAADGRYREDTRHDITLDVLPSVSKAPGRDFGDVVLEAPWNYGTFNGLMPDKWGRTVLTTGEYTGTTWLTRHTMRVVDSQTLEELAISGQFEIFTDGLPSMNDGSVIRWPHGVLGPALWVSCNGWARFVRDHDAAAEYSYAPPDTGEHQFGSGHFADVFGTSYARTGRTTIVADWITGDPEGAVYYRARPDGAAIVDIARYVPGENAFIKHESVSLQSRFEGLNEYIGEGWGASHNPWTGRMVFAFEDDDPGTSDTSWLVETDLAVSVLYDARRVPLRAWSSAEYYEDYGDFYTLELDRDSYEDPWTLRAKTEREETVQGLAVRGGCANALWHRDAGTQPLADAEVSAVVQGGRVWLYGELIRAVLEWYYGAAVGDDYLDHVFYAELQGAGSGRVLHQVGGGAASLARLGVVDDFYAAFPARVRLTLDDGMPVRRPYGGFE